METAIFVVTGLLTIYRMIHFFADIKKIDFRCFSSWVASSIFFIFLMICLSNLHSNKALSVLCGMMVWLVFIFPSNVFFKHKHQDDSL
jgi:uncharacterized membrane protein